jgi:hypothetical protein
MYSSQKSGVDCSRIAGCVMNAHSQPHDCCTLEVQPCLMDGGNGAVCVRLYTLLFPFFLAVAVKGFVL